MTTSVESTTVVKQTTREPLANVCGLTIAPARVAAILGKYGLNEKSQKILDEILDKKEKLKKLGAPAVPPAPAKDEPKLTEAESAARKDAQKAYKDFKSDKYVEANNKFSEWKALKKSRNEAEKELKKIERLSAYEGEDPAKVRQRTEASSHLEEQKSELDKLNAEMAEIEKDEEVKLFVEYDTYSKQKIRVNREAHVAVAGVLQEIIEQIAYCTMEQANLENKKIIMPLHSLGDKHDQIPLFPLMANLPAYKKMCEYKDSIKRWEEDCKKFDVRVKNEAKKRGLKIKDHMAHKKDQRPKKPVPENYCPPNASKTAFEFYIGGIFTSLRSVDTDKFSELRISSPIKTYLSNLALDFCNRLVPWIMTVIHLRNIKTVGWEVIMSVVELMLIDGGSEFYVEDIKLTIKDRIDKLKAYNAKKKSRGEPVEEDTDADDNDDEEDADDTEEEAAEPAPARRRRRVVTGNE